MSNPPTLIFIPGSWHKPICYDPVIKLLQDQHDLKCIAITLPSTSGDPAATFKDDVDVARAAIADEISHGRNVVVVAHSYGGMVGNSAIKGFAKTQHHQYQQQQEEIRDVDADVDANANSNTTGIAADSETQQSTSDITDTNTHNDTAHGNIIGLILIASGFTLTGVAFMDPFLSRPPPSWRINPSTGYAELVTPPEEYFYHDLPPSSAAYWTSQLTTQSLKALFEGREYAYAGWRDVPTWYIGTVEDRGLPVLAQRMQVGMAREMGGRVQHRELQTSHSPFLSQPGATVGIMVEAVEAFVREVGGDDGLIRGRREGGRGEVVAVRPEATLWRPLSWFKFGLPLVLGHVVGRGILAFAWGKRVWRSRLGLRSV
ncbi:alpha/beta hydrolase [Aspergillus melleus]|uniref:alpha/beta hydrolase n=1 Tax=Aspergillus melleus TaxID=138277 RepID=UPI001E8D5038|nr:uncharacterized protein LDX57_005267 [Aspergillus melleus]KAH8427553.1 hypothetical protein LDX57_005267 [Aspergillus melleus]